jgi:hypothetical protein
LAFVTKITFDTYLERFLPGNAKTEDCLRVSQIVCFRKQLRKQFPKLLLYLTRRRGRVAKGHSNIWLSAHRKHRFPISKAPPLSHPPWAGLKAG